MNIQIISVSLFLILAFTKGYKSESVSLQKNISEKQNGLSIKSMVEGNKKLNSTGQAKGIVNNIVTEKKPLRPIKTARKNFMSKSKQLKGKNVANTEKEIMQKQASQLHKKQKCLPTSNLLCAQAANLEHNPFLNNPCLNGGKLPCPENSSPIGQPIAPPNQKPPTLQNPQKPPPLQQPAPKPLQNPVHPPQNPNVAQSAPVGPMNQVGQAIAGVPNNFATASPVIGSIQNQFSSPIPQIPVQPCNPSNGACQTTQEIPFGGKGFEYGFGMDVNNNAGCKRKFPSCQKKCTGNCPKRCCIQHRKNPN